MCLACTMPVKPIHGGAPTLNRIPCGRCKSCNEVYQKSWSFRLRVELDHLVAQNWQVGFLTLTYNDMTLPYFPRSVFVRPADYKHIMCFNRDHCEGFIRAFRSWLWREYALEGPRACRYCLASEFGSTTKRSHYHLVVALPPDVDMRRAYNKLKSLWTYGYVFPRYFEGGVDSHGYHHKPFVCQNPSATAKYVAKYTTKDMYYNEHIENCGIDVRKDLKFKSLEYRRLSQFHLQSRSLGALLLDGMSDDDKLKLLNEGYQFVGDDKRYTVPIYYRNRIIFDNVYQWEYTTPKLGQSGEDDICFVVPKRRVLRDANSFFIEHYSELFRLKAEKYEELFKKMSNYEDVRARGVTDEVCVPAIESASRCIRDCNIDWRTFAEIYLAYYGVPDDRRLYGESLSLSWLNHYVDVSLYVPDLVWSPPDEYTRYVVYYVCCVASHLFSSWYNVLDDYSDDDRFKDELRDYFGHLT